MHVLEAALVSNIALRPRNSSVLSTEEPIAESSRPGTALAARFIAAMAVIAFVMAALDLAT